MKWRNQCWLSALACIAGILTVAHGADQPAAKKPAVPAPKPTLADVHYGPATNQVLDFYKAESKEPTPLMFYMHGGAWMSGSKASNVLGLAECLAAGISVVSIEYRFVSEAQAASVMPPVEWPMHDAARALQFVRSKAAEWNLDKQRIGMSGNSAGACTSLWLAFHDDMADPRSDDPVARESTRLMCVAVREPQTSLDPKQMKEWMPNSGYGGHAFGFTSDGKSKLPPFQRFLDGRESVLKWIKEYSPYELVTKDDPPVYMFFGKPLEPGQNPKDLTHSAIFGIKLQEHLRANGVACELVYPDAPDVKHRSTAAYLIATLKPAGVVKTEFIFEKGQTPQCHASTVVETASGLVAAWFGGTKEAAPDVGIWLSRLVNGAWTTPVGVADGVHEDGKRFACFNPVLFQPAKGPLMLFYKVAGFEHGWAGFVKTSTDDGRSWSKAKRLPDGIIGPVKNKPVQLPNGDLLSGSSTEYAGWRVHFERSSDQGATWQATAAVNDPKEIGAIQPAILQHGGGKLQALCRTRGMKKIGQIWSEDGGRTWGKMELTNLAHSSAGIDALTLHDGSQLLVYNHTLKGRARLNVATSKDGRQWNAALMLEGEADKEFSYPAVIQTRDGLVHITYTWKRERIKHVVLDPAKLQTRPIVSDEWPQ